MPPKVYPKFPSRQERMDLIRQLEEAQENGTALTSLQHFTNYLEQLKQLNETMDQYSEIDAEFGLPPDLDEPGKALLLEAMHRTAVAGERFLADAQRQNASLNAGTPRLVGQLQGMLAQDFDTLRLYNPNEHPMSFPELQQLARTQVVDLRGKQIGIMTNKLSARIPMTVVDLQGNRRPGVFTKASYVDLKSKFETMLRQAAAYYDEAAFRNNLGPYKRALFNANTFPDAAAPGDISDQQVIDTMKGRILNAVENYRARLIQQGEQINGKDPRTASVEQVILGLTGVYVQSVNLKTQLSLANDHLALLQDQKASQGKIDQAQARVQKLTQQLDAANATLDSLGLDLSTLPEEVSDELKAGLTSTARNLTNMVNVRDLDLQEGQRYDHRNSAMSAVAGLMGMNKLIARSENMKFLDEDGNEVEGTFMEFADGLDLHGKDGLKEFNKVADDPFAPPCKALPRIADLQAFDYLCGNVDRHGGNMSYKVDENGKFVDIVAFDNDTSFGTLPIDPKTGRFRQAGIQDLKVISKPMSRKLMSLTPEMLKFSLRGRGLTDREIQASCDRLAELKTAIQNGMQAKTIDEVKGAGPRLCIMETEDLEKIHINDIPDTGYALFHNVRAQLHNRMKEARKAGHEFDPGALEREGQNRKPQLTEVSTTERRLAAAAGIAESMSDMDRMLENRVTGFRVSGLSKFLHSSGNWRDMIKAVKKTAKAANDIRKAIGPDKEGLRRDDPKVQKELRKADEAMKKALEATDAYLQKKMREKHVDTPEALSNRGKHAYEQRRMDYAMKLRKSLLAYNELKEPDKAQQKQAGAEAESPLKKQQEAAKQLLDFAEKRKARQPQQGQLLH
ncbi:MAG: hypothetical protein IKO68_02055 [Oscillospiraceae bacterium]|nr:hypothetical protein [Oscillospiraceae bacterium]